MPDELVRTVGGKIVFEDVKPMVLFITAVALSIVLANGPLCGVEWDVDFSIRHVTYLRPAFESIGLHQSISQMWQILL